MNGLLIALLHRAEVPIGLIPLAGEIEYRSWLVTAQELRDQYEYDTRFEPNDTEYERDWDAYFSGNPIEEKIEQRRAIMRGHSPECNIVLNLENRIISPCTCG